MTAFHETTTTILKYVLTEQQRDLFLAQRRLEQADETTLKTDVERERFPKVVATFREQIAELTDVVADFERLIRHVADTNATEAYVDLADAERYAQRDEFVNGDEPNEVGDVEYVDYEEAAAVREIEREMAIEAGDDSELDRQVAEDDARFERAVWLAEQAAHDAESEAAL